jgi:hypothetical protein
MEESKGEEIYENFLNNTTPPFSPLQNLFIMEKLEQLVHTIISLLLVTPQNYSLR